MLKWKITIKMLMKNLIYCQIAKITGVCETGAREEGRERCKLSRERGNTRTRWTISR
jgi:hypothetical protein